MQIVETSVGCSNMELAGKVAVTEPQKVVIRSLSSVAAFQGGG